MDRMAAEAQFQGGALEKEQETEIQDPSFAPPVQSSKGDIDSRTSLQDEGEPQRVVRKASIKKLKVVIDD